MNIAAWARDTRHRAADPTRGEACAAARAKGLRPILQAIREHQASYRRIHREPSVDGQRLDAEQYCDDLLDRLFIGRAPTPRAFFASATASCEWPPLLHVLAAHHALRAGQRDQAGVHARKAVALDQFDLYAQRLVMLADPDGARGLAETEAWLADRFCPRPFEVFETRPNGDVNTCCDAWMPAVIGNIADASGGNLWNSSRAQEIRRSVLDGDFRYCSRMFCPKIVGRSLPQRSTLKNPAHLALLRERRTVMSSGPVRVLLSHDRSCNLSCPSCRRHLIIADKANQKRLNRLAEEVILPLLRDARQVKVTGSGDPFGSHHFRYILKRLDRREFPNLLLQIQTNGQLLDQQAWSDLGLEGLVESVWVSIDAARKATYERLRRGGSFARLMRNLDFVAGLRREERIRSFQLDAVVQAANLDELPEIVDLGRRLGADRVHFQRIRNWGTFTAAEFADHDVASSGHPRFAELCAVLRCLRLAGAHIDLGNLASLAETTAPRPATTPTSRTGGCDELEDRGGVPVPGWPASIAVGTAAVGAEAAIAKRGAAARSSAAQAAALAALREEQLAYDALIALTQPATRGDDPEAFCRRLLARLQVMLGPDDAGAWQNFVVWAQRRAKPPRVLHVLAAVAAGLEEDWPRVFQHAKAAIAVSQRDTFAQRLFLRARARIDDPAATVSDDLSDFFCPEPFESFELRPNGDVHTCCPAWLPVPIGNFHRQTPEEIWNSPAAQAIRRSILDGSFRHCSRMHCPAIVNRRLPRRADLKDPSHREIVAKQLVRLERRPVRVLMSQDLSCNLSCPSCRTKLILARKSEQDRLNEIFETVIFPLLRDARQVKITGSGDPFASGHFRYVLRRLSRREFPQLRVQLQTNGLLFDRRAWEELELEGLVESVWVSIDAARPETYAVVRRGGSFSRLLQSLAFLGSLRRQHQIRRLRLDFVVQALNFREMPEAVVIARAFGFDAIYFQMIRNWGTFSAAEFGRHFIGAPDHPDYGEFLEVLRHPNLAWAGVNWSNLRRLYERANG